ncbi:MAG: hypothetical protein U1F35_19780 [Steroidobacteraceae bacterium]
MAERHESKSQDAGRSRPGTRKPATPPSEAQGENKVQGEGDYEAARRYRDKTRRFIDSGQVEEAAEEAEPHSESEADDMRRAEDEGLKHRRT